MSELSALPDHGPNTRGRTASEGDSGSEQRVAAAVRRCAAPYVRDLQVFLRSSQLVIQGRCPCYGDLKSVIDQIRSLAPPLRLEFCLSVPYGTVEHRLATERYASSDDD